MPETNQNVKGAKIGVVLTDPDDWTASAFLKNLRTRGPKAFPINLTTVSASISTSDFSIFHADLKDLEGV